MKPLNPSRIKPARARRSVAFLATVWLAFALAFFCPIGRAQQTAAQLSLADILIGLRSKKASLDERNRLLTDAVKVRGITFSITPEIETELAGTGASVELVGAIRQKSVMVKTSAPAKTETTAAPVPDAAFYRARGDENSVKGDYDTAVKDYDRAVELNPKDAANYLHRARANTNRKSFDLAMLDYDKTIELNPKNATAYFNRGDLYEKRGESEKALSDYRKAVEFDADYAAAKKSLERLQDEQARNEQAKLDQARVEQEKIERAKLLAKQKEEAAAAQAAQTAKATESKTGAAKTVELGSLVAQAVKMVVPAYPAIAKQSNIVGQVVVQITLDETGAVVSVKATSGPAMLRAPSEEAARRTKFKPALVAGSPAAATGYVVYNFTGK